MKVAITSTGNSPDSKLDCRFGRCSYFVIFDTLTKGMEILPNPYKEAEEGAGTDSVKLLSSKGAGKIISGEFGIKIKPLLDSLKIQMIILKDEKKSIQDIINMLTK
jgi:predicted Fe-Mo cluster-binding NifX family protein